MSREINPDAGSGADLGQRDLARAAAANYTEATPDFWCPRVVRISAFEEVEGVVSNNQEAAWMTVRQAIREWGSTLRLIAIMVSATACLVAARLLN